MATDLDRLVANLVTSSFKNIQLYFEERTDLLFRKGVFPYDYMDSLKGWMRKKKCEKRVLLKTER